MEIENTKIMDLDCVIVRKLEENLDFCLQRISSGESMTEARQVVKVTKNGPSKEQK